MGGEEQEKKENSGYGERLREITAVLKKHETLLGCTTHAIFPGHRGSGGIHGVSVAGRISAY